MMNSFRDVIDCWGRVDVMATAIAAPVATVRKWRQRDSIPAEWWLSIERAAAKDGLSITVQDLAILAEKRITEAAE
jgi:hypothetical protein